MGKLLTLWVVVIVTLTVTSTGGKLNRLPKAKAHAIIVPDKLVKLATQ